jgi:uncharacterized protein YcaQ
MGMYDNVKCLHRLPVEMDPDTQYQTKNTPEQFLDNYLIDVDGSLLHEDYDVEDQSDPNAVGIARILGCMTRVNRRWIHSDFSGRIQFYTIVDDRQWTEFVAAFENGKLVGEIELVAQRGIGEE